MSANRSAPALNHFPQAIRACATIRHAKTICT